MSDFKVRITKKIITPYLKENMPVEKKKLICMWHLFFWVFVKSNLLFVFRILITYC